MYCGIWVPASPSGDRALRRRAWAGSWSQCCCILSFFSSFLASSISSCSPCSAFDLLSCLPWSMFSCTACCFFISSCTSPVFFSVSTLASPDSDGCTCLGSGSLGSPPFFLSFFFLSCWFALCLSCCVCAFLGFFDFLDLLDDIVPRPRRRA